MNKLVGIYELNLKGNESNLLFFCIGYTYEDMTLNFRSQIQVQISIQFISTQNSKAEIINHWNKYYIEYETIKHILILI